MVKPDESGHEDLEATLLQEPAVILRNFLQHLEVNLCLVLDFICTKNIENAIKKTWNEKEKHSDSILFSEDVMNKLSQKENSAEIPSLRQ